MRARDEYAVTVTAREHAELLPIERDSGPWGPREVVGRTLATLVSAGTELASAYTVDGSPRVPGYAAVFEVEEVGDEVADLKAGDRVFFPGPHRSYQRASREQVLPVPDGLSPEDATFARMMSVSMSTLTTAPAGPPAQVLVMG